MRLGTFIPTRENFTRSDINNPAILLDDVGNILKEKLKQRCDSCKGNLDIRKARIENGIVIFKSGITSQSIDSYFWYSQIDRNSDNHDMMMLSQLEDNGVIVFNDFGSIQIGIDKLKTSSFLNYIGIKCPEFVYIDSHDEYSIKKIFEEWKQLLIKPRFGGFGIGIVLVENVNQLFDIIDFSGKRYFYAERFYNHDMDKWISLNVVGNKVLYSFKKEQSKIKDYKVIDRNMEGGKTLKVKTPQKLAKIALEIREMSGLDFFGVDFIKPYNGDYLVVDVNTFPGIYTEIMPADKIANAFVKMITDK